MSTAQVRPNSAADSHRYLFRCHYVPSCCTVHHRSTCRCLCFYADMHRAYSTTIRTVKCQAPAKSLINHNSSSASSHSTCFSHQLRYIRGSIVCWTGKPRIHVHALESGKSQLSPGFVPRPRESRQAHVTKAARSATFSEDPWQEDSGRHEVFDSMEEVCNSGPVPTSQNLG